jgi:hypothetical protein
MVKFTPSRRRKMLHAAGWRREAIGGLRAASPVLGVPVLVNIEFLYFRVINQ